MGQKVSTQTGAAFYAAYRSIKEGVKDADFDRWISSEVMNIVNDEGSYRQWKQQRNHTGRCVYCTGFVRLHQSSTSKMKDAFRGTIDHVVARELKGGHDFINLVLACKPCNKAKGTKNVRAWVESTFPEPNKLMNDINAFRATMQIRGTIARYRINERLVVGKLIFVAV